MNGKALLLPLARLLMSSLFVWDGIVQLHNLSGTAQYFASVHVPVPNIAVWISILVHLLGGLAVGPIRTNHTCTIGAAPSSSASHQIHLHRRDEHTRRFRADGGAPLADDGGHWRG